MFAIKKIIVCFWFPLLLGVVTLISVYQLLGYDFNSVRFTHEEKMFLGTKAASWVFCIPFGYRVINYLMSKLVTGIWIVNGFVLIFWWLFKLSISVMFAPFFFAVYLIAFIYNNISLFITNHKKTRVTQRQF
ncbi:hypothetical protein [Priestia megaterium]|uniref:hypothetical protein n=1 Tax=Priestia megaterium TaxID=1404 RepID=UPI002877FCB9|nr:hypothetical protein [Priestia megaterium]